MTAEFVLTSPGEESIGPRLARLRTERGMTTAAAAAKLHCDETILQALESERFNDIGARVFVQGHLRRYAEFLGAPVDEILAEWSRRGASFSEPDLTQVPRAPARAVDPQAVGRRVGYVAAAVVITVAAWWILQGGGVARPPKAAVKSLIATPVVETSVVASPAVAPPVVAPAVVAPVIVETPVAAPPVRGQLALALTPRSAESWVEVYDAAGKRVFFDLVRRGNRIAVQGAAPLRVLLGRADVTAMELDGRDVTIPSEFMYNGTAHFTIDPEGKLTRVVKPAANTSAASTRAPSTP
ncbi:MAG: helix-turn-helix domain-containing protein [Steroidobacteraceae bacterium]|nr:helix-turn-helix domain-containing protein [Gammaproteobacteria bacterium]